MKTMNTRIWFGVILISLVWISCEEDERDNLVFEQNFNSGKGRWEAVFAEYPPDQTDFYELDSGIKTLPEPLDQNKSGFMLSGNNHSDALQMFLVKKIEGLDSTATYEVNVKAELASQYPDGSVGAGGSPANAVHLVAHACGGGYELIEGESGNVQIEFDKESYGYTQIEMGDIAIPEDHDNYEMIQREGNSTQAIRPNNKGEIWMLIGTWSGFEGITTLYYTSFKITFTEVE